jgi:hypothetical protein
MPACSGAAAIGPAAPIEPQPRSTVNVSIATPSTLPVRISIGEADDSRTSRILFDFSSITLLSRIEAPVMIKDHSRKPPIMPISVGSLSRNDTSPPP